MYCSKNGKVKSEQLPPCHNALKQHILRCNYQARIWRLAFESNPTYPEFHNHGWYFENEAIKIRWMTCQPAPNEVLSLLSCSCNRTCQPTKCSCIDNRMHCTDLCLCGECQNTFWLQMQPVILKEKVIVSLKTSSEFCQISLNC